jgi:branched-chain amino acid transport system ATP-binding protein
MTARENVLTGLFYGRPAALSGADAAREADRMLDFVGLVPQAERPVASLNLMERKFVELARALATRPKLLLLDELMAGLNPNDLGRAIGIIRKIRDDLGVTVLWIEHIMQVLMNTCEHLIVLHHGEKLAEGAPQAVVSDPHVADAYFGKKGRGRLV